MEDGSDLLNSLLAFYQTLSIVGVIFFFFPNNTLVSNCFITAIYQPSFA